MLYGKRERTIRKCCDREKSNNSLLPRSQNRNKIHRGPGLLKTFSQLSRRKGTRTLHIDSSYKVESSMPREQCTRIEKKNKMLGRDCFISINVTNSIPTQEQSTVSFVSPIFNSLTCFIKALNCNSVSTIGSLKIANMSAQWNLSHVLRTFFLLCLVFPILCNIVFNWMRTVPSHLNFMRT